MKCPRCKSRKTIVYDSRKTDKFNFSTYRRRMCNKCNYCWSTYEIQQEYLDSILGIPLKKMPRFNELINALHELQTLHD